MNFFMEDSILAIPANYLVSCSNFGVIVLGTKEDSGWTVRVLSSTHNGAISSEQARIRSEHPNEPEAMLNDRVLGGIAVTRGSFRLSLFTDTCPQFQLHPDLFATRNVALGDLAFILPRIYTDRVFAQCKIPFKIYSKLAVIMKRNLTPPYLSYAPDIQHARLAPLSNSQGERFLIM